MFAGRDILSGFIVTITPGRPPMWATERRQPVVLDIPYQKARLSPDGFFHLCMNDAGELLCFYSPGGDRSVDAATGGKRPFVALQARA